MEVFAEGFAPKEIDFAIVEKNPTVLNITLRHVRIHIYSICLYTTRHLLFHFLIVARCVSNFSKCNIKQ